MVSFPTMYHSRLQSALPGIREAIERAAARSGRSARDVRIVAVTKGHPVAAIRAALDEGLRDVGENRVEALEERVPELASAGVTWHMIGHLQSRKAARAVALADLIHSVDSLRLGERLSRAASDSGRTVNLLMQVNTAGEESKSGVPPEEALDTLGAMVELPGLEVRGLMTMAPFTDEEPVLRRAFSELRRIHEEAGCIGGYRGRELSMGMSNDFVVAVEEGSTIVRLGTALFGERP
jgi:PLP dependent protein